ncbi:hypothetical protein ACWGI8_15495 [Streptomyces sp. NPDC054841]
MESSVPSGIVHGAEDVRTVPAYARTLYEHQHFVYVGEYGENGFVDDYASKARGEPIANSLPRRPTPSATEGEISCPRRNP